MWLCNSTINIKFLVLKTFLCVSHYSELSLGFVSGFVSVALKSGRSHSSPDSVCTVGMKVDVMRMEAGPQKFHGSHLER